MEIHKNPELFSLLVPIVCGRMTYYSSWERCFSSRNMFDDDQTIEEKYHPPGEPQYFSEGLFFIGGVAITACSRLWSICYFLKF